MKRAPKGEGSYRHIVPVKCEKCKDFNSCLIRKEPSGKCRKRDQREFWRYQYHVPGIDGKSVRRVLEAKTYKELVCKVDKMRLEKGDVSNDTITVGQWCDRWRDAVLPGTIKNSTLTSYKYMLSYIPEYIRKKKLMKLTPIDLQTMFSELKESGSKKSGESLSSTTVRGIRSTLISCFQSAIDNGFLIINVAKKTKPPLNNDRREISFLTEDEMLKLISVADSGEYYEIDEELKLVTPVEFTITLDKDDWENQQQIIDIPTSDYVITDNTRLVNFTIENLEAVTNAWVICDLSWEYGGECNNQIAFNVSGYSCSGSGTTDHPPIDILVKFILMEVNINAATQ